MFGGIFHVQWKYFFCFVFVPILYSAVAVVYGGECILPVMFVVPFVFKIYLLMSNSMSPLTDTSGKLIFLKISGHPVEEKIRIGVNMDSDSIP